MKYIPNRTSIPIPDANNSESSSISLFISFTVLYFIYLAPYVYLIFLIRLVYRRYRSPMRIILCILNTLLVVTLSQLPSAYVLLLVSSPLVSSLCPFQLVYSISVHIATHPRYKCETPRLVLKPISLCKHKKLILNDTVP